MFVLADHALAGVALLPNDVAENAALFFVVVVPAVVDFFAHAPRNNRKRYQLRVRVLDGGASCFAVILENKDITEALVVLQVQHSITISPKHIFHSALG